MVKLKPQLNFSKIKDGLIIFLFIFAILLWVNRWGFTYRIWIDNVLYCKSCEIRHVFEHFVFGLFLPLGFVFSDWVLCKKRWSKWKIAYFLGAGAVIYSQLVRVKQLGLNEGLRTFYDLCGVIYAGIYLRLSID